MNIEPVIGLEIHVQLKTKSKMFCGCNNNSEEAEPNTNVCPVCLGMPGVLPMINKEAVRFSLMVGIALGGKINCNSHFDRKNYFYPDLPKGYQISQYKCPLISGGVVEITCPLEKEKQLGKTTTYQKQIKIKRIHLEEDAGKLIHPEGADYSLVDLNRAGTPLLEIVTEPVIRSPQEASIFLKELRSIMRYLNVSNADMEKGHLRCDANVSLREEGTEILGTKTEVKNMNSFRAVEKALAYEIKRQEELLEKGKKIVQETRGWDETSEKTISQRSKEEENDYRYFPEPDLPPLEIDQRWIKEIKAKLPETSLQRRERFETEYKLNQELLKALIADKALGDYFEEVISELKEWIKDIEIKEDSARDGFVSGEKSKALAKMISQAASLIVSELIRLLNEAKVNIANCKISPENFAELITIIYQGEISQGAAKEVLGEMFKHGSDPSHIIDERGLAQINDPRSLRKIVNEVIEENTGPVSDYKSGKMQALGFLVGKVMQKSKGKANPEIVNELLRELLS